MEFIILLVLAFLLLLFIMPFVAMTKASRASQRATDLERKVEALERRLNILASAPHQPTPVKEPAVETAEVAKPPAPTSSLPSWLQAREPIAPPPVALDRETIFEQARETEPEAGAAPQPPTRPPVYVAPRQQEQQPPVPAIDWEQFMGAKLFAWVGGFALFLGVAFFIKYSFDHNLIPPAMRAAIGFAVGLALVAGGVLMRRKETAVTAQTLASTGTLVLYGVTFACRSYYHFPAFTHAFTFALMSAITVVAFLLSVNMNAMAVAVLGIAGGFLTPALLSTGQDTPLALFGYIALLDIGLLAVALRQRWHALPVLGAIGTLLTQAGWVMAFFDPSHYFPGDKIVTAMAVFAGFQALFLAAAWFSDRSEKYGRYLCGSALAMGGAAMLAAFYFVLYSQLGERPGSLFGYMLAVDLGLLALFFLEDTLAMAEVFVGSAAFFLLGIWSMSYLSAGNLPALLGFYLAFSVLHLGTPLLRELLRKATLPWWIGSPGMFTLPFWLLSLDAVKQRPGLFFGCVLLIGLVQLAFAFVNNPSMSRLGVSGLATFLLLASWTSGSITSDRLNLALGLYFAFALLHTVAPMVLHRVRGAALPWWSNAVPALALVLAMMPIFQLPELSMLIWPLVLLLDILAVILAAMTATLLPVLAVLLLSFFAVGAWIFRIHVELTGLPTALVMVGAFSVFFPLAAAFTARKLAGKDGLLHAPALFGDMNQPANLMAQISVLSTVMPFVLLIMVLQRLNLSDPSPVFGVAMLIVVIQLAIARLMSFDGLPLAGLASALALEVAERMCQFNYSPQIGVYQASAHVGSAPDALISWYLAFYIVFTIYPFLFHRKFAGKTAPWIAAALAGPLHFYLVYDQTRAAWPALTDAMGLVPAAFCIPALLGVAALLKRTPADSPARNSQLSWHGGAALFFITLIIPIQFHREWITLGWALEGAALCWLFTRVPHRGLAATGACLLTVSFCRLALNPAVLDYYPRAELPLWNWYLYVYGIATACLFTGAWLLSRPKNPAPIFNAPPLLCAMGTVLAFLLVNIEIADYFTAPGTRALIFEFSGNFGRDMSYSIAWALFALLMLIAGIAWRNAPTRYASIALLGMTLLKLFLHDFLHLEQLFRIAAFIIVAAIAIFASFLYQRFFGSLEKAERAP